MAGHNPSSFLLILLLAAVCQCLVAPASGAAASGVVLSDVNNMLRDATKAATTSEKPVPSKQNQKPETDSLESSVELLRFVDDDEEDSEDLSSLEVVSSSGMTSQKQLGDQVRLLTKQLGALMLRRREDYEMLEHNLRKSLRLTTDAASADADMRSELKQLR